METSDDPIFGLAELAAPLIAPVATGLAATALTGGFSKPDKPDMPAIASAEAGQATKTAEPVKSLSAKAKKNKLLAASALTRDWAEPTLGKPALLGVL